MDDVTVEQSPAGSSPEYPCRLFVYLASDAPVAVVLRRGPSDWARLTVWETDGDRFEHGQWLRGRVYERRCDLSPDGRLFAAFIRQSGTGPAGPRPADSWIAVSRPPYFTALAIWFVGGTYITGPLFETHTSLRLPFTSLRPDVGDAPAWFHVQGADVATPHVERGPDWTNRTIHFSRLRRHGWTLLGADDTSAWWEHLDPSGRLALRMFEARGDWEDYGGPYVVSYEVRDVRTGHLTDLGRGTWADWDQNGRLLIARDGRLGVWTREAGVTTLCDFNGHVPDPAPPPERVRRWPAAPADSGHA